MVGKNPPGHRPCRPVSEVRQSDRPLTESPKSAETTETTETTRTHAENPSSYRTREPLVSDRKQNAQTRPDRRFRPFLPGKTKGNVVPPYGRFLAFRFYQANPPEPPTAFSGKEKQRETPRSAPPCIGDFPSSGYSACRTAVIRSRSSGDDWAMYSAAAAF